VFDLFVCLFVCLCVSIGGWIYCLLVEYSGWW
jgi:hypothetical protein